jgi:hypothetical protein
VQQTERLLEEMDAGTAHRIAVHFRINDFELEQLVVDEEYGVGVAGAVGVFDADFPAVIPVDAGGDVVGKLPEPMRAVAASSMALSLSGRIRLKSAIAT